MSKARDPVLVKHVIEKVLKKLNPKNKERLKKLWETAAGPELSRHTRLASLRKGRLTVEVENSSWLYEMTVRHKPRLLKELQSDLGEKKLKELRFRLGTGVKEAGCK